MATTVPNNPFDVSGSSAGIVGGAMTNPYQQRVQDLAKATGKSVAEIDYIGKNFQSLGQLSMDEAVNYLKSDPLSHLRKSAMSMGNVAAGGTRTVLPSMYGFDQSGNFVGDLPGGKKIGDLDEHQIAAGITRQERPYKPSMADFMAATGADFQTASNVLYGMVGSNNDTRDWNAIMSSSNPFAAAAPGAPAPPAPAPAPQQRQFTGFGDVSGQITGGARNGMNWDFMDQQGRVLTSIPYQDYVDNYMSSGSGAVRQGISSVNGVSVYDFNQVNPNAGQPAPAPAQSTVSNNAMATSNPQVMTPPAPAANTGIVGSQIARAAAPAPVPAAPAPMLGAQTFTPQQSIVDRPTETAAGQVQSLLAQDSPLLQRARTLALQNMNQRGLVNSSMAQGAGVAAMVDRITPIAMQDAQTFSTRTLANMEAANQAGMFNAGEQNRFSLQRNDQAFTGGENQAQRNFTAAQAELDRAQQVALADKSIAAQQALQTAQQNFAAAQAALDRTQQVTLQTAQQNFAAAQAALDRAQQITLADKSVAAQQALQAAQQEFQRAQAELDRTLQTNLADKNLAAQQTQLQNQQSFAASQAALDRQQQTTLQQSQIAANQASQVASQAFQASQTNLEIASRNSTNASAFISRTIDQANASINAIIADGNLTPDSKKNAVQNIVDSTNSSLQWAATFYNTTVPGYTAPGGAASVLNPGAGAGGGNAATGQTSTQTSNTSAGTTTSTGTNTTTGGTTGTDTVGAQVVVYGPDGTQYSSPAAARAAGVTNYTTTPPSNTNTGGNTGTGTGSNQTADPTAQALAAATAPQRAYLQANPDVVAYYYANNLGGTEGISLGDFAQRHYEQAGFNEGRNGYGLTAPNRNTGTSSSQTFTDAQVAAAIQQSVAQGFTVEQAANAAMANYGVPADQIARVVGPIAPAEEPVDTRFDDSRGLIYNQIER